MVFFGIYIILMGYRVYSVEYNEAESQKVAAELKHDRICSDPQKKDDMKMWDECEKNSKILGISPRMKAIYALLDSLSLCSIGLCNDFVKTVADRLQGLLIVIGLGYFIICWLLGRWVNISSSREEINKLSGLGGYGSDKPRKKTE